MFLSYSDEINALTHPAVGPADLTQKSSRAGQGAGRKSSDSAKGAGERYTYKKDKPQLDPLSVRKYWSRSPRRGTAPRLSRRLPAPLRTRLRQNSWLPIRRAGGRLAWSGASTVSHSGSTGNQVGLILEHSSFSHATSIQQDGVVSWFWRRLLGSEAGRDELARSRSNPTDTVELLALSNDRMILVTNTQVNWKPTCI